MELYSTFLRYLSLKEIDTQKKPMTAGQIARAFQDRFPPTSAGLDKRIRKGLEKSVDEGLATKEALDITPMMKAYHYSLTEKYYETLRAYELG